MKTKLIILLLLIVGSSQVKAQKDDYIPLAIESAQWLILRDYVETPYPDEYFGYKIIGDTTINDTTYKKVYKREFESVSGDYVPPYEITNEYFYGAVRDDVENRKIYGRGVWNVGDYLMFDYNLQIGDTNTGSMCQIIGDFTVTEIYYSTFQSYNTRVFKLEAPFCFLYLFEGIGSANGLFEGVNCFEQEVFLLRYCQGSDQECLDGFLVSVEEVDNKNKNIMLSPNPAKDIIYINYANHLLIDMIIVSDISGKNVIEINEKIPDKIKVSKLNIGLYFINFYIKNQLINTQKIIKN